MFTKRDKIKELINYFGQNADYIVFENSGYKPVGVSKVLTFEFTFQDTEIVYNKWFVECFDKAKFMGLPGTEHHNKMVKGSGVNVISKRLGRYTFYGQEAQKIIDACESNRDITSNIILNHRIPQK